MLWSGTEPRRRGTPIWREPDLNALDTDSSASPGMRSSPVRGLLSRSGAALNLTPELLCFIVAWHSSSGHAPSVISHLWCLMENSCCCITQRGGAKVMMAGKKKSWSSAGEASIQTYLIKWLKLTEQQIVWLTPDGENQRVDLCLSAKKECLHVLLPLVSCQ